MSKTTAIVFIVVFALEAVVIIIGNVFTMFVFWTHRMRVKRACFLLINLAVADFLVGIAEAIVLAIEKIPNEGGEEKPVQRPWAAFQVFTSRSYFAGTCFRRVEVTASSRNKLSRLHLQLVIVWGPGLCTAGLWVLTMYHPDINTLYATVTTQFLLWFSYWLSVQVT